MNELLGEVATKDRSLQEGGGGIDGTEKWARVEFVIGSIRGSIVISGAY